MRAIHLVASAAVIAGFGAVVAPASGEAAASMCRGRTATIVGDPSIDLLRGTAGDDVIVTNGSGRVKSFTGADVVCITGESKFGLVTVNVGRGSDMVFNESNEIGTETRLGQGNSETYIGGAESDEVRASGESSGLVRIETGAGRDDVTFVAAPSRVAVDLGSDQDGLTMPLSASTRGTVDGGSDEGDRISISDIAGVGRGTSVVVDNTSGVTIGATKTIALANFEVVGASDLDQFRLTLLGGPASEFLGVPASRLVQRVNGRGGDDVVLLQPDVRVSGSVTGGGGNDFLSVSPFGGLGDSRVAVDLGLGRVRVKPLDRDGAAHEIKIGSFERLSVQALEARLIGTTANETFFVIACQTFISARGGNDALTTQARGFSPGEEPSGSNVVGCRGNVDARFLGGGGDDTLTGSEFADVLIGGGGSDTADGQGGDDTCDAEVTVNCTDSPGPLLPLP